MPFEQLNPTLKALNVDGVNILSRSVSVDQWGMTDTFGVVGADAAAVQAVTQAILAAGTWLPTNRDPTRLTSLILTGVTALTRATAWKMETQGILYPREISRRFFRRRISCTLAMKSPSPRIVPIPILHRRACVFAAVSSTLSCSTPSA